MILKLLAMIRCFFIFYVENLKKVTINILFHSVIDLISSRLDKKYTSNLALELK